jgi:predicted O-linked N-acetylglucosamine transferase (SPINDLY family)
MTDEDLARTIRDDRIDVLVILAGRFDQNRPLVAAYRAAPVQISFHDPGTSGLSDVDYLIADRFLAPPQGTERFTERVVRLPYFYVHEPLAAVPPVKPLPLLSAGGVTFGCFNNPAKLSDDCLALWARVLQEIPRARLLLKFRNWYQSAVLRQRIAAAFERGGVSTDRLTIVEADRPGVHHLEIYNEVDVALDPFPFTGSTTTFEALWMGVPVITLAGTNMISRWTTSMLHAARLEPLAAATPAAYIAATAELVSDSQRLAALRATLRPRIAASPLCDGQGRTRQLERIYRTVWRRAGAHAVAERQR